MQQEGPGAEQIGEPPASPQADVWETVAQEPTFPSQPQTVIHVLSAGQSQLPTEHHMICCDIRSARHDSPSASLFHTRGLHHLGALSLPLSRWYRIRNCCFLTKYFCGLISSVSNRRKNKKSTWVCLQPELISYLGSNWTSMPGSGKVRNEPLSRCQYEGSYFICKSPPPPQPSCGLSCMLYTHTDTHMYHKILVGSV